MSKSNVLQQKIAEKKDDLEKLQEFRSLTSELATYLEGIGDRLDQMKEGTESAALILANWQNVVKAISLASLGLLKYSDKDYETKTPLPEALVRIKLDKDEEQEGDGDGDGDDDDNDNKGIDVIQVSQEQGETSVEDSSQPVPELA
ncbi:DASH complex subunit Dad2-domain-containing protein [Scheffersomyces amazonensis]|uniref:DASH complex subunit Dad2-domain-containing protein n=1 Tax=Scheffersomyces amazonensis TaxID=1078765 RepID=UPI00315DAC22